MAFLVLMLNEKEMMKDNDFSRAAVKTGRRPLSHPKMVVLVELMMRLIFRRENNVTLTFHSRRTDVEAYGGQDIKKS